MAERSPFSQPTATCLWRFTFATSYPKVNGRRLEVPAGCAAKKCGGLFFGGKLPECEDFLEIEEAIRGESAKTPGIPGKIRQKDG